MQSDLPISMRSDSTSKAQNITKTDIDNCLRKIKSEEKAKKSIVSSPMYKAVLFLLIGIVISFFAQCKLSLNQFLLMRFVVKNRIRLLIYATIYFLMGLIAAISIKFKFTRIKPIHIIIGVLYAANSAIYSYGYTHNHTEYPYFEYAYSVIITAMILIGKEFKTKFKNLGLLTIIGIFLVICANILEIVVSAYYENDTSLMFIFFNKDHYNNGMCLLNAAIFTSILILFEKCLTTKEEVSQSLPYIGAVAFGVLLLFGLIFESGHISGIGRLRTLFILGYVGLMCANVIVLIIVPHYIRKCSSFIVSALSSMEILCNLVINAMFPSIIGKSNQALDVFWHYIGAVLFIVGISIFLFEKMKNSKDIDIEKVEEIQNQIEDIKLPLINNDDIPSGNINDSKGL